MSVESTETWTDEQMMDALQAGVDKDSVPEQAPVAAPVGETQDDQPAEPVQPAAPAAPEPQNTEGLFDGTSVNPDELPEELQPLARQLQAAFTQKTQALAEQRKQIEDLGDVESIQAALELTSRIGDPSNWQQLHAELTQAMQQYGMTPAEAAAAAAEVVQEAQAPLEDVDPELAPFVQQLQAQQAELEALKLEREQERQNAQAEYERQAFLGELQRQENAIRATHPDWDDEKILAVYQMSSFFNGNLTSAAERLEGILANERALYLAQKEGVANELGTQRVPATAGSQSQQVSQPSTLQDAEDEAIEFFKNRVAHYDGS